MMAPFDPIIGLRNMEANMWKVRARAEDGSVMEIGVDSKEQVAETVRLQRSRGRSVKIMDGHEDIVPLAEFGIPENA